MNLDDPVQKSEYQTQFNFAFDPRNDKMNSLGVWGFTDLYGSTSSPGHLDRKKNVITVDSGGALLFDSNYAQKTSYVAAKQAIQGFIA